MKRILLVLGCLFGCLLACGQLRAGQIPDISDWSIEEIFGQTFVVRVDAGRQEFMKTAVEQGLVGAVLIKRFEGEGLEDGHAAQKRELTRQTVEDLRAWAAKSPRKMTSPRRRRSSCSSFISVLPPKITEITASRARYQYTLPARPPQAQMPPKCVIFTKSVDIDRILQYIHCINSNAVTGTSTPQHRPQRAAGQVQGSGQGCG